MAFSVEGRLHKKLDEQSKSERFRVREFVLEIMDGQYPQMIKFQLVQDRVTLVDNYQEGDTITVHFDLSGREYTNQRGEVAYFTNLTCWKIDGAGAAKPAAPAKSAGSGFDAPMPDVPPPAINTKDDTDDLPF